MRFVRFKVSDRVRHGRLENGEIHELEEQVFESPRETGETFSAEDVNWLPPCSPRKVMGVYVNDERFYENEREPWSFTHWFYKTPNAIVGHRNEVRIPRLFEDVETELELVTVIGEECRAVSRNKALDKVFGYAIGNDITISKDDFLRGEVEEGPLRMVANEGFDFGEWLAEVDALLTTPLKGSDTTGPIGPWIDTDFDYRDKTMTVRVNGEVVERGSTSTMQKSVQKIIHDISQVLTLEPGDVIFTGTQTGLISNKAGDRVSLDIEGLGRLTNTITQEEIP